MLALTACAAVTDPADDGGNGSGSGDGATGPAAPSFDEHGVVGSAGRALLDPSIGSAIVEIDTSPDRSLGQSARDALGAALGEHGGKAVTLAGDAELPAAEVTSEADLRALAKKHRDERSDGDTIVVHVLVLSGRFEDEGALGVAFDATSFAVFPDQLDGGLFSSLNRDRFEQAVAVHELGHLFGLVNLTGEGGFHEDADNPGHSRSEDSVMFWAIEDVSVANVFRGGSPPTTFDDDDRQEMKRISR